MNKKILITGIDGFTGRYLAKEMAAAGYDVIGLALKKPGLKVDGAKYIYECDLCDFLTLEKNVSEVKPDIVAHLAAIAFVAHGEINDFYKTNLIGSRNLLEALLKLDVLPKSILMASSANVYGNQGGILDESIAPSPTNDYAVSKLAMEYVANLYKAQLPIIIVRPFNYTGVGQSINFLIPKIIDHFKRCAPFLELGNLDVIRDFSDVRSVVKYYRLLIEAKPNGEIFNICSGNGHSLTDILKMMNQISGHYPEIRVNQNFVRTNEVHCLIGLRTKLDFTIKEVEHTPFIETLKWMLNN